MVPEEGWFGQPKYSTRSKNHSTLCRFLPLYSLFVCSKYKEMYGNIEGLNIVNLYRVMSMLKLKINVYQPCVLSFLCLKMANLSDLLGFTLTITTR